ncbi:sulfatase-like hydrolase/transferase [Reichenbachiella agarivorans]|uniref:Sulfatase-like hydrolase/transferase n=1 Tax=Reichenbachiella agarivorans TaxID=2979464 RepID=A0ABY6CQ37_9BACT|nr:sulfatase-like hydrolase/transferase [Reichenbachiella agarivorans]UXP32616.1 sulfatase-like hydrolase/transferase [Reichenbachiella agarivorans]
MKRTKLCLVSILVMAVFSCKQQNTTAQDQPNIVVILCDDLGYGDLSSYGHPVIQTPNLDNMAARGIQFSNFYAAAPVCSPSRVGLMTGRSPNRAGIYDFIIGGEKPRPNNRDLVHMQADEETIPARLKSVGYATCLSGKWHCSSLFNNPEKQPTPDHFGFDHWFATHNNAAPSHENPRNFVRNGEEVGEIEGFSCQIVVDEAMSWLDQKPKDQPFYLQVTFHEPHVPVASPQELVQKYLPQAQNENEAQYFANVENVDLAVGRLMDYLTKKGYDDNTLVIFTSDNGPETLGRYERAYRSYGSPGELKGMKLWTNEAGFRVPGIMYWMGQPMFQGKSDAVISSLDFMPTFCELAGAELPKNELDGESMVSMLKTGVFERNKPLLWAFYNALNDHVIAMRDGDWKIMARLKYDSAYLPKMLNIYPGNVDSVKSAELVDFELYSMVEDKGETKNLAEQNPEQFANMKMRLDKEYQELLAGSHVWER